MVPHGDAGDAAQSRRVVDAKAVGCARDDVVRVLVLDDHVDDRVDDCEDIFERLDRHGYDDCNRRVEMRALVPVGRALYSLIFITSVFGHFSSGAIDSAAAHGVPFAVVLVPLSGILALVGGLSVLLGYRARFGAFMLLLFLVPVTLVMHKFWGLSDPQMAMMQRANFMKNLSLIGGALVLMYYGAGPVSLDN